ncbi:MAG: HlyD family efflux transporter periplasmic adaptor subunit [Gemmataceae bacterium]
MFRWMFVSVLLSACGVVAVWMLAPHLISAPPSPSVPLPEPTEKKRGTETPPEQPSPQPRRRSTPAAARGQTEVYVYRNTTPRDLSEPIIIPDGKLEIVERQEVASQKEGILLFIGTDVLPGENVSPDKQLPEAQLGFLAILVGEKAIEGEECFQFGNNNNWYRRARATESLDPEKVFLFQESRRVRKLQVGDRVKRGQLLAMVNPAKASDDVAVKIAKLNAVERARLSAANQRYEYDRRLSNYREANRTQPGSIPQDSLQETHLQFVKSDSEEKVKRAEIVEAQSTLNAALTDLKMHEIRAAIDGVIKVIYKNHQGDAVKPYESVMQIQNPARLRVEGRLEQQEAVKLKEGMTAIVEANRPEAPKLILSGHLAAVNCVAVSKGKHPVIVSGSDDETLRGWDSVSGEKLWEVFGLHSAVRSVACTPPGSKRNLACFGTADGTIRLLDLDNPGHKRSELAERHKGSVLGVAFSPYGEVIATCGDDHSIRLWKTETGALLHTLVNAHYGAVTSVQFASAKRLVSAGKDNRLAVWDVEEGRPPHLIGPRFEGRGGEVLTLGVSPDGKTVLFDQGKELSLLTLEVKQLVGSLQKSSAPMNFSTMALFSPDGKTILTNRSAPGSLQLWRTPVTQPRGSELRQFIWSTSTGTANCGAFAPEEDGSFAVTGMQDAKVLVWAMPSKEEIDSPPLNATLTLVDKFLDTHSRHVRIWSELVNTPEWLLPGMRATMVVLPPKK